MPKPNYAFEKRQRELEKKRKKEDKAQKKAVVPPSPDAPVQPDRGAAEPESTADTATPG
jgi:hypothetical protein